MPPPSSGGVLLLEMLNVLEGFTLRFNDPDSVHLLIETMKRAYADRAQHLGDPDRGVLLGRILVEILAHHADSLNGYAIPSIFGTP